MAGPLLTWIKRRKVTVLLLIVTFIVSGLLVNLIQLLTLPLYCINKWLYRHLNARIVYLHWCILPWTLECWAEYDIRIFVEDRKIRDFAGTEHALVVLNHRGDLDWMIGWVLIDRLAMLGGTKAIMKDVAKYLPGIGWSFMFMEYPLLKRDWVKDKERLAAACRNLADYPVKMLLCLFAEGTRFTPEKHKLSMEYAKKNGLPILKNHLFPRTKGFCFLVKNFDNTIGAVYDITTCYRGRKEPSIMGVVNAESCAADICVRRYPISDIPKESDEALSQWLVDLFKDKDELIEYHNKHKCFPGEEYDLPTRPQASIVVAMWICLCSIPLFLVTLYLAWVGKWLILLILIGIIIAADQLFQMIARETQVSSSSSSYGLQPVKKNGVASSSHSPEVAPDSHNPSDSDSSKKLN